MNQRLKTTLLVFFFLTTLGTGILAWQQYRMLQTLRSDSSNTDTSAALKKKLADAEHRAHALQNEIDALKAKQTADNAPSDEPPGGPNDLEGRRGRGRGGPEGFGALMNNPKFAKLMNAREKQMISARYAALFKSLVQSGKLTTEQVESFQSLLAEKQTTMRDIMTAAREQGITDRSQIDQLVKSAQAELDAQLQSTLGADAYAEYQAYEQTYPQRSLVSQLEQSLSYSSSPLTDAQSQQLLEVLASTSTASAGGEGGPPGGGGPGGPGGGVTITDATLTAAQSVLSAAQLQALTELKEQQTAQRELMATMRANRQSSQTTATSSK